jgi:hypothetical protein
MKLQGADEYLTQKRLLVRFVTTIVWTIFHYILY